jgi:hypothetical protein
VEAENKSDDICEWTVKGKQESDERYAVVARSRKIQTNGGPSNGPASRCRQTRRLALVRASLAIPGRFVGFGLTVLERLGIPDCRTEADGFRVAQFQTDPLPDAAVH